MRKLIYIVLIFLISINMTACGNNVVAKVNDADISMEQYKKTEDFIRFIGIYSKDEDAKIDNNILSFIIDNEVVYQSAKEKGYKASEDEINSEYDILKSNSTDEKSFEDKIKENELEEEFLKNQIEKDIIVNKYKKEFIKDIKISDKEMNSYFNNNKKEFEVTEVRANQILISTQDDNNNTVTKEEKENLKNKAENILEKINSKKEKFENLAITYSDDKKYGKNGGDLGYFSQDDKNSQFTKIVFKLDKNEISEVFETYYGYHIVKITDKRIVNKTFDESKEKIKENLLIKKYMEHVDLLYKNAKITIT